LRNVAGSRASDLNEVDVEDLVEVLSSHFGGARYARRGEIDFGKNDQIQITLRFSKDRKSCESAVGGTDLDETTVAELEKKIREEVVESVARASARSSSSLANPSRAHGGTRIAWESVRCRRTGRAPARWSATTPAFSSSCTPAAAGS